MPGLNVRLTEAQHEELRQAVYARGRGWSMQKEVIGRLFGNEQALADGGQMVPDMIVEDPGLLTPAKRCPREARHHINHSGKPCPECGFPKEEA